jgi:hypothetical protein
LCNAEQTAAIAEATGRPLRYIDIPENAARDSMLAMGMPAEIVEGCWNSQPRCAPAQTRQSPAPSPT